MLPKANILFPLSLQANTLPKVPRNLSYLSITLKKYTRIYKAVQSLRAFTMASSGSESFDRTYKEYTEFSVNKLEDISFHIFNTNILKLCITASYLHKHKLTNFVRFVRLSSIKKRNVMNIPEQLTRW